MLSKRSHGAALLEAITGKLGAPCLVSDLFAKLTSAKTEKVGEFSFKGIEEPRIAREITIR